MNSTLHRKFPALVVSALTCALFVVAAVRANDIKVVTSGGFTAACLELVSEYERLTHIKLVTEFGPSMGTTHNAIPIRLERGEVIDVVIMAAPALADLMKQGIAGKKEQLVGKIQQRYALKKEAAEKEVEEFARTYRSDN